MSEKDFRLARTTYRAIEGTSGITDAVKTRLDREYEPVTPELLTQFQSGAIDSLRFDIDDRTLAPHVLGALFRRAADPTDPLYSTHGAQHKVYAEVLHALIGESQVQPVVTEIRRVAALDGYEYFGTRLVIEGGQNVRTINVPYPYAVYSDLKKHRDPARREREYGKILKEDPFLAMMIQVLSGAHRNQVLGFEYGTLGGVFGVPKNKEQLRQVLNSLNTDTIRRLQQMVDVWCDTLIVPGTARPSVNPDKYAVAMDAAEDALPKATYIDKLARYVEVKANVKPLAVVEGVTQIVQEYEEAARILGDLRTTGIYTAYGNQFTTDIVTAYFMFGDDGYKI